MAANIEQGIPAWSHDGTKLTFGDVPEKFGHPRGSEAIHIYDLVRHTQSDVPGSLGLWSSRWSPDGRYLSALTIVGQELMLFDLETGEWRSLNVDHVGNHMWSRDERYIYYGTEGVVDMVPRRLLRRVRVADGAAEDIVDLGKGRYRTVTAWVWTGLSLDDSPVILGAPGGIQLYALDLDRP